MEIDELIDKRRWFKSYEREKVSDYIAKDVAPDMTAVSRDYAPIIDGILTDYKLNGEYALYQEDGHDFMTFRASECNSACDKYQSSQDGDFIIIQLDAINKECGSAGYGSAGMSNARYSDKKTEKSSENVTFRTRWGDLTIPMTINIGGEEVEYEGFDASGNSCRSPEGKSPHKIEYRKGDYYVIVDLDNSKVSFGREGSMWYNSEDYTYLESIKGLIEHGEYYINSPYVTKSKTMKNYNLSEWGGVEIARDEIPRMIEDLNNLQSILSKETISDSEFNQALGTYVYIHDLTERGINWMQVYTDMKKSETKKSDIPKDVPDIKYFEKAQKICDELKVVENSTVHLVKHTDSTDVFLEIPKANIPEDSNIKKYEGEESDKIVSINLDRLFKSEMKKSDDEVYEVANAICNELNVQNKSGVLISCNINTDTWTLSIPIKEIINERNLESFDYEVFDEIVDIKLNPYLVNP